MRIFVESWEDDQWFIDKQSWRHIRARRLRDGDAVILIDGCGRYQHGVFSLERGVINLGEAGFLSPPSRGKYLAFAWSRPAAMDLIVEKAVEMGVTDIILLATQHVGFMPSANQVRIRMQRFRALAESALCQSSNCYLPRFHGLLGLDDLLKQHQISWAICSQNSDKPEIDSYENIGAIIGPEGGFSDLEYNWLSQRVMMKWSLSSNVLRVETAAIAAMTIMNLGENHA